jgi:hypothetical protein
MLQILRSQFEKHDKDGMRCGSFCGLRRQQLDGRPIWCSQESWDNRDNFAGWKSLK